MKKYSVLLLLIILATYCNGQDKAKQKQAQVNKPSKIPAGQPRIIKTQVTNEYASFHCGVQDKAGNLWFGTTGNGVYRYDGKSFINFTDKDGLCNNSVCSILEDRKGNIWVGTNVGVCRYDGKTFTNIVISFAAGNAFNPFTTNTPVSSQVVVWCMFQDKKGNIWFGTNNDGVYKYDGTSFSHFLHNDGVENKSSLRLNAVKSILEDKAGNIWFATWFEGLCRYDGKSVTNFKPNGEVWYACILEDKKGNIWAGRRSYGVCRYDGKTFTNVLQHGIFDSCCVNAIAEDKAGNIWFGTEAEDITKRDISGGAWRYDGTSFKNFTTKDGLPNYSVFFAMADKAGNIWFGTRNTGLCRYDGKAITNFTK